MIISSNSYFTYLTMFKINALPVCWLQVRLDTHGTLRRNRPPRSDAGPRLSVTSLRHRSVREPRLLDRLENQLRDPGQQVERDRHHGDATHAHTTVRHTDPAP